MNWYNVILVEILDVVKHMPLKPQVTAWSKISMNLIQQRWYQQPFLLVSGSWTDKGAICRLQ